MAATSAGAMPFYEGGCVWTWDGHMVQVFEVVLRTAYRGGLQQHGNALCSCQPHARKVVQQQRPQRRQVGQGGGLVGVRVHGSQQLHDTCCGHVAPSVFKCVWSSVFLVTQHM